MPVSLLAFTCRSDVLIWVAGRNDSCTSIACGRPRHRVVPYAAMVYTSCSDKAIDSASLALGWHTMRIQPEF